MNKFFLILFLFISSFSVAQRNTFELDLNNQDFNPSINSTFDKKILISSVNRLICLDSLGKGLWTYTLNPSGNNFVAFTEDFKDQSIALVTQSPSTNSSQIIYFKNGVKEWERKINFKQNYIDNPIASCVDKDTLIVIAQSGLYQNGTEQDILHYMIKLKKNGDSILVKEIPNMLSQERAIEVFKKDDTTFVFTRQEPYFENYLLKLDNNGNLISRTSLNIPGFVNNILQSTNKENFTLSSVADTDNNRSSKIIKINNSGKIQWENTFFNTSIHKLYTTSDNGFVIDKSKKDNLGWSDIYIYKLDSTGQVKWESKLGGVYDDYFRDLVQTSDGGYAVLGYVQINDYVQSSTNYLFKLDNSGIIGSGIDYTFSYPNVYFATENACWGDIDGDSDPDVFINGRAYENSNGNLILIDPNDFTNKYHYAYYPAKKGAWSDFDNINGIDLYHIGNKLSLDEVYLNQGSKKFVWDSLTVFNEGNFSASDASIIDFNNDGYLDIFLQNANWQTSEPSETYRLYQNQGDNSFKISTAIDFSTNEKPSDHSWIDYDNDHDFDLFIINNDKSDNKSHSYKYAYENDGIGNFTDISKDLNFFSKESYLEKIVWQDIDNDNDLDAYVSPGGSSRIYFNDGKGKFDKDSTSFFPPLNAKIIDYDNDGDLDYSFYFGIYRNDGYNRYSKLLRFIKTSYEESQFLDMDSDGDLDFFGHRGGLYSAINNGSSNNWTKINLKGVKSNQSGIGATISIKANIDDKPTWQTKQVVKAIVYDNLNSPILFGLDKAQIIDSIKIVWPSGCIQYLKNKKVNEIIDITESCFAQSPALIDTFVCDNESIQLTTSPGSNLKWYNSLNATEPIFVGKTINIPLTQDKTTYFVANADSLVESRRTPVIIRKYNSPVAKLTYTFQKTDWGNFVIIRDSSIHADAREWTIDNRSYSNQSNISYLFKAEEEIIIKLVVSSICGKDSVIQRLSEFILEANYANPAIVDEFKLIGNPVSEGSYFDLNTKQYSKANIEILNYLGENIFSVLNSELAPGSHRINLFDAEINSLKPGMYFAKVTINGQSQLIKLIKL